MSTVEKVATELANLQDTLGHVTTADADTTATLHDIVSQFNEAMLNARAKFAESMATAHNQFNAEIDAAIAALRAAIDSSATERADALQKAMGAPLTAEESPVAEQPAEQLPQAAE